MGCVNSNCLRKKADPAPSLFVTTPKSSIIQVPASEQPPMVHTDVPIPPFGFSSIKQSHQAFPPPPFALGSQQSYVAQHAKQMDFIPPPGYGNVPLGQQSLIRSQFKQASLVKQRTTDLQPVMSGVRY